jgi:hypothetical protein
MHHRQPAYSSDEQAPPPAFPLVLVLGGLIIIAVVIISVFIWVAADDAPARPTLPGHVQPTAESRARADRPPSGRGHVACVV